MLTGLAAQGPLLLAIDGSVVGRGCVVLLVQGTKGHFPEAPPGQLVEQLHALGPPGALVIFLGDGEFDGVTLQAAVQDYHWAYVCRTARNVCLTEEGVSFTFADLPVEPGDCLGVPEVLFPQEEYGPVLAIAQWQRGYQEPLYLVTNLELPEEACYWYAKRFRIETFFSDQKSRGFNLHKSHIADPPRLARLMIAACLAYIWIVYLGVIAQRDDWVRIIHRPDRCDWSLFRLGLALFEHFLNEDIPIPVAFHMPEPLKSVR